MTPDALRWLLTDEAAAVVADLDGGGATPAVVAALRKRVGGAERAAAAIELAELRRRARAKFAHADAMFFTRKALEQATDQWVARYKAERFAGFGTVVDACCGVGGDLIGLAGVASRAVGVDADGALAEFARRNALACGREVTTLAERLDAETLPACDAWHADPDRRPAGRRTTNPDTHEPSLDTLAAWRRVTPAAAIKLAPAARLPDAWRSACELEWISRGGECRQLVAWAGPLASDPGLCRATRVAPDAEPATLVGEPGGTVALAERLGAWVHEPDPAVLAADLVGAFADKHALAAVAPRVAYLTSDAPLDTALGASFRVEEVLPFSRKRLAGWLAERNVGRLEIKCRGVEVRPEKLRQELKPKGDASATLLIYADAGGKRRVIVAQRRAIC